MCELSDKHMQRVIKVETASLPACRGEWSVGMTGQFNVSSSEVWMTDVP